jgi:phage FluMu protein Com
MTSTWTTKELGVSLTAWVDVTCPQCKAIKCRKD